MTDPLLRFRDQFPILGKTTYLVSNALGAMPRGARDGLMRSADAWEEHGVRAWARGWWELPVKVGDEIAPLVGAGPGEVAMVPTVTIQDNSGREADAGQTNMTITLELSGVSSQTVSAVWFTSKVTALSGSDYLAATGTVVFPPGATNQTLSVAVLGDVLV